jgi:hydroxymethylpyrimidine/phosphomethylpyrimidine kinase
MGCHPLSVVTAVTVQDTVGVDDFLPIDAAWMVDQARSVLEDMPVAAIKIGMIGSVEAVAPSPKWCPIIPTSRWCSTRSLTSGRGDPLANEDLLDAHARPAAAADQHPDAEQPGSPPAGGRSGRGATPPNLSECARRALIDMGCEYVLITGAHEQGAQVSNTLYNTRGIVHRLNWDRLPGSYHGSGCTLASACRRLLALGQDMPKRSRKRRSSPTRP